MYTHTQTSALCLPVNICDLSGIAVLWMQTGVGAIVHEARALMGHSVWAHRDLAGTSLPLTL